MRERKKTGVHGTLEMILLAWKFNSKQLLCKTLNSRMNIIKTRAVLNIVQTDGKWAPEAKREGENIQVVESLYCMHTEDGACDRIKFRICTFCIFASLYICR